jgi:hypothetical protein
MLTLTEPQIWVLIGVFAAAIFGMMGIVTTSFNRTLTSAIRGLEDKVDGRIGGLDGRIDGLHAEINGLRETMDARFAAMDAKFSGKFDLLDRDIQALSRRVFGTDPS